MRRKVKMKEATCKEEGIEDVAVESKSGNEKKSESENERSYLQRRRHRGCCCGKVKTQAAAFQSLSPLLTSSLQLKRAWFRFQFFYIYFCPERFFTNVWTY